MASAVIAARGAMDAVTKKGNSCLAVAAKHGSVGVVEELIRAGARADGRALLHSMKRGEEGFVDRLCSLGALEPDSGGLTPLMMACAMGEPK